MKHLHTALVNCMEKEANQVQFFKELRVLNPRRLCHLSHSLADYPSLKLHTIPGAQEEWQAYVGTEFRDISGPAHLLQCWEARPALPFKDGVLVLVCMVMGTSSVERFFSFCKYIDTDQRYSMSDNARRVAFMAHYNGDVEGRLDQMLVLKALVHSACYVLKFANWVHKCQKNPFAKNLVLHCCSWLG